MHSRIFLAISLGAVLLSACKASSQLAVEVLYQSQHCQIDQASVEVLDTDRLVSTIAAIDAFKLDKEKSHITIKDSELAILIAWGAKPNSAYHVKQTSSLAILQDGSLDLPIEFISPAPGTFAAQVVITPCIILKTTKHEAIQRISAGPFSTELK